MRRELSSLLLPTMPHQYEHGMELQVNTSDPKYSAWMGGSIVAEFAQTAPEGWMLRSDYDEEGPSCVELYCRN